MKCKLNIVEPWESGTESAINATIVKDIGIEFLIFIENNIKVRNKDAHYFVCKLKNDNDQKSFNNRRKGAYLINMAFDENIHNAGSELPPFHSYRSNFLLGEIII